MSDMTRQKKIEGGRKRTAIRFSPLLTKCLALYAANHEQSVSEVVSEVVEAWWKRQPDRAKYEKLQEEAD